MYVNPPRVGKTLFVSQVWQRFNACKQLQPIPAPLLPCSKLSVVNCGYVTAAGLQLPAFLSACVQLDKGEATPVPFLARSTGGIKFWALTTKVHRQGRAHHLRWEKMSWKIKVLHHLGFPMYLQPLQGLATEMPACTPSTQGP